MRFDLTHRTYGRVLSLQQGLQTMDCVVAGLGDTRWRRPLSRSRRVGARTAAVAAQASADSASARARPVPSQPSLSLPNHDHPLPHPTQHPCLSRPSPPPPPPRLTLKSPSLLTGTHHPPPPRSPTHHLISSRLSKQQLLRNLQVILILFLSYSPILTSALCTDLRPPPRSPPSRSPTFAAGIALLIPSTSASIILF